jgi:hypothetical protein
MNPSSEPITAKLFGVEREKKELADSCSISVEEYNKLAMTLHSSDLISCLDLLRAKKYKSARRAFLARKIRDWLKSDLKIGFPLSKGDLKTLEPKWPVKFHIPGTNQ